MRRRRGLGQWFECRDEFGTAISLIAHNRVIVADPADRVAVMYEGDVLGEAVIEQGKRRSALAALKAAD